MPERMTRTPEMREFIDMLNKSEFKQDLHKKIEENNGEFKDFRKEHKEEHTVTIGNGAKKTVSLRFAVGEICDRQELMRDRVDQIYVDTTFLRDANTLGSIIRRYKWVVSGVALFILSTIIKIWMG